MNTTNNKNKNKTDARVRLAILQRVCPNYRIALFSALSTERDLESKLFIGEDIPESKVKNAANLSGINVTKLKTRFVRVGQRIMPWHLGLINQLKSYRPDVILCEGESHFLGYVQAIIYRTFFNRKAALIHWCFISLPGDPLKKPGIESRIKAITRRFFDAFLLYSSYSKTCLLQLGIQSGKAFVATNVGDVKKFIVMADSVRESREEARIQLSLPQKFTVLYTGTLDPNKKPDLLLDLAAICDKSRFNFVLLGSGALLEPLRKRAQEEGLTNVYLPGKVVDQLPLFLRAADTLIIPGRGGIVISEAMAFSLPVIIHQADGTEYDLVKDGETGFILRSGETADFKQALEWLEKRIDLAHNMGRMGRSLVEKQYTTANMVSQIKKAAHFAASSRT